MENSSDILWNIFFKFMTCIKNIFHKIKSIEGAAMVTLFCKNVGNYKSAIEFLIMQKK